MLGVEPVRPGVVATVFATVSAVRLSEGVEVIVVTGTVVLVVVELELAKDEDVELDEKDEEAELDLVVELLA